MSDARDAVARAVARLKALAASRMVEKQELESKIAELGEGHPEVPGLAAELAAADRDYRSAMTEIVDLGKLARDAEIASSRRVVTGDGDTDPYIRTDEAAALENVRGHLAELEARIKVNDELRRATSGGGGGGGGGTGDGGDGGDDDPPTPPARKKRTM